jgi:hypothetical protein
MLLHYLPVWLMRSLTETLMLGFKTAGLLLEFNIPDQISM